jgi:hypothetical protein
VLFGHFGVFVYVLLLLVVIIAKLTMNLDQEESQFLYYLIMIAFLSKLLVDLNFQFFIEPVGRKFMFFSYLNLILVFNVFFALGYSYFGLNNISDSGFERLIDCLYFSFITWTTIGYGDISPIGFSRFFAVLQGFLSYLFMALLIAKIHYFLLNINVKKENNRDT